MKGFGLLQKRVAWVFCGMLFLGIMILGAEKAWGQEDFSAGDKPAGEAGAGGAPAGDAAAGEKAGGDAPASAGDAATQPAEAVAGDAPVDTGSGLKAGADEADQVETLTEKFPFKFEKEKDPFKPIVEKKVAQLPVAPPPSSIKKTSYSSNQPPAPPPPPPLKLQLTGVVGNDSERLAMIMFENELKIVKKDEEVKGKFKVVEILPDKVVVYSNKEQMRRTFPLGQGGGGK